MFTEPPSYEEAMHICSIPAKSAKATASAKANTNGELLSCTQDKEDCQFNPLYAVFNITEPSEPVQKQQQAITDNANSNVDTDRS